METFANVAVLLIDGNRGIYIAQEWAKYVKQNEISLLGIDRSDFLILLNNPDHEDYSEIWNNSYDEITMQDKNGQEWQLYQNGDLWMYPFGSDINWSELEY